MTIASSEGIKLNKEKLDELIELSNHDVRQAIYNLHMFAAGGNEADVKQKDVAVVRLLCFDQFLYIFHTFGFIAID